MHELEDLIERRKEEAVEAPAGRAREKRRAGSLEARGNPRCDTGRGSNRQAIQSINAPRHNAPRHDAHGRRADARGAWRWRIG